MTVVKKIEKVITKPVDWLKEFRGAYLSKHQGEVLERTSTPLTHNEALSLGKFGYEAAYAVSACDHYAHIIKVLTGHEAKGIPLFTETIGRASGSIGGFRMEKNLEAVANIGQFYPDGKRARQAPEEVDLNG